MRNFRIFLAAVAATLAAFVLPANAAPLASLDKPAVTSAPLVQKTHGWHYRCAWGPYRYHRHVEGVGNVPCYKPRYWRNWENYDYYDNRKYKRRYRKNHDHYNDDNDDDYND
jgi:hypothetical protein